MKLWSWDFWKTGWLLLLLGIPAFFEHLFQGLGWIPSMFDPTGFLMGSAWGFLIYAIAYLTRAPVSRRLLKLRISWPILLFIAMLLPLIPLLLELLKDL